MRPDFIEKSLVNQMVFYQRIAHTVNLLGSISQSWQLLGQRIATNVHELQNQTVLI